jgi:hypothetical protein
VSGALFVCCPAAHGCDLALALGVHAGKASERFRWFGSGDGAGFGLVHVEILIASVRQASRPICALHHPAELGGVDSARMAPSMLRQSIANAGRALLRFTDSGLPITSPDQIPASSRRSTSLGNSILYNLVSGMGGPNDISFWDLFWYSRPLSDPQREALGTDAIVKRGLELIVADALSPGWDVTVQATPEDPELGRRRTPAEITELIHDYERRELIDLTGKLLRSGVGGRQFGHAIVWLGIVDGRELDEPVDFDNIQTISWAHVIDRRHYQIGPIIGDEDPERFGQPAYIKIIDVNGILPDGISGRLAAAGEGAEQLLMLSSGMRIHPDRYLWMPAPNAVSVLDGVRDSLASFFRAARGVTNAIDDAAITKWKIHNWRPRCSGRVPARPSNRSGSPR